MNTGGLSPLLLNWFFQTKNIFYGTIYKHPGMKISDFDNEHLAPLFAKTLQEKQTCLLMGDFNINLWNADKYSNVSKFCNIFSLNFFVPYILQPKRLEKNSKTLIDFTSLNSIEFNTFSDNFTLLISDHLPHFFPANI